MGLVSDGHVGVRVRAHPLTLPHSNMGAVLHGCVFKSIDGDLLSSAELILGDELVIRNLTPETQ